MRPASTRAADRRWYEARLTRDLEALNRSAHRRFYHKSKEGNSTKGPFSLRQFLRRFSTGSLTDRSLVWMSGMAQWAPLLSMPGAHFVNLQYGGDPGAEIAEVERSTGVALHNFADIAWTPARG